MGVNSYLQGIIFSWNKASELLYGYTEAEMIGQNIKKLFPTDKQNEFEEIISKIENNTQVQHKETIRIHKDGHAIPVSITISPIKDAKGQIIGASTTARDITQQKLLETKLRHLAEHDALTGLINRPLFEDRIEHSMKISDRQKCMMAVCFLDIDNFKVINDQYGHATGDALLCVFSRRLQEQIRSIDTLARLSGDEFALLFLNIQTEQDVAMIAKKLLQACMKDFIVNDKILKISISIGIALYPKDGSQSLIQKADAAMYYVKKHGKNDFKFYDSSLSQPT